MKKRIKYDIFVSSGFVHPSIAAIPKRIRSGVITKNKGRYETCESNYFVDFGCD